MKSPPKPSEQKFPPQASDLPAHVYLHVAPRSAWTGGTERSLSTPQVICERDLKIQASPQIFKKGAEGALTKRGSQGKQTFGSHCCLVQKKLISKSALVSYQAPGFTAVANWGVAGLVY